MKDSELKPKKKRDDPEARLQRACIKWFRHQYPRLILFAVPNGGSRNKIEAAKLKAGGVLAGVSDLVLFFKQKAYCFELKAPKGVMSKAQIDFMESCTVEEIPYFEVSDFDNFKWLIQCIVSPRPTHTLVYPWSHKEK